MGLQVWLPLNGNLTNQGLTDMTFSYTNNNGKLSVNSSGKIGKCYERTASAYADVFRSNKTINLSGDISMCCWAYVSGTIGDTANGLVTNHSHADNTGVGITVKQVSTSDYRISCNTGTGSSRTFHSYYGTTNIKNAWHHLALTYNKVAKVLKLWVDGKCEYTLSNYTNASKADYIDLFNWSTTHYTSGDYRPTAKLNDVRVYDNCLSAAEIREIAKGLVLHYKLSSKRPITNTAKNKTYTIYNNYGVPATLTALNEKYQGCTVYRLTMTPNSTYLSHFRSSLGGHGVYGFYQSFAASTKYCFWILYRPVTHSDIRVGGTASNISGWTEIAPHYYQDGWYRVGQYRSGSVTEAKSDNIFTSFYSPSAADGVPISIDFCCPHLIQGYTSIQEEWGYQTDAADTQEYDCSGNGYHGTITGSGIGSILGSVRNEQCYEIRNSSSYITTPTMNTGGFGNSFTISWWSKNSNMSGKMAWGFSDGNRLNLYPTTNFCWNTGDGGSNPFINGGAGVTFSSYNGAWHHYAITGNGSTNILYIDGVQRGTSTTYKGITGTKIYISGWDTGTSYKWTDGTLSDFRLYGTCLSADDIKMLYNTPIKLSNNGALLCSEVKEKG